MKAYIHQCLAISLAALGWFTQPAQADSDGSSTLSGDWGGLRRHWADQGVNFEAIYTADVISNRRGGLERGTKTLDNIDLLLMLDGAKLYNRPGLTVFLYGLGNHGGNPSDMVGDLQGLDNIEAPTTWKIYEAWIEQSWSSGSLRAGLYDLNSEFDAVDTASLFLGSSHGIGPDFSQTGQNGPSIFPATSPGIRLTYQPSANSYVQAVVLDGVPGDPNNPHGTQIEFNAGDGALLVAETGLRYAGAAEGTLGQRYSLGVWHYTAKFDDLLDTDSGGQPIQHRDNQGLYVIAEGTLYHEAGDAAQGLNAFCRLGLANADVNILRHYLGVGLVYTGLFTSRPQDKFGLALAHALTGDKFRRQAALSGPAADNAESAVEISYRASVLDWLAVQPDLQYIIDPGADPALDNALVLGARFEISL